MSNSKKIASIAFTGAAVTAATMMAVGPALATTSVLIKNGGVLYTGRVRGRLTAGTTAVLVDTTKNTTLTCKKATFSGTVSTSTVTIPPPRQVGVISRVLWSSCTGPFGFQFNARLNPIAGKPRVIVSTASLGGATGKLFEPPPVSGKISVEISGTGLFNTCKAFVSGTSVPTRYSNARHQFVINAGHKVTLHVWGTTGFCAGAINKNDNAYISADYIVTSPAALTVSEG